jgi:FkbM family methyltransferase
LRQEHVAAGRHVLGCRGQRVLLFHSGFQLGGAGWLGCCGGTAAAAQCGDSAQYLRELAHNILSLRYAISDSDGKSEFFLAPDINTGYSGLFRTAKYSLPTEIVPTITLQRLAKMLSLKKVKLMKLDVESYEYEVILGSKPLFESDIIENIVLELHPSVLEQRGKRVEDIEEFLLSAGYKKDDEFGKVGAGHRDGMLFRKQV